MPKRGVLSSRARCSRGMHAKLRELQKARSRSRASGDPGRAGELQQENVEGRWSRRGLRPVQGIAGQVQVEGNRQAESATALADAEGHSTTSSGCSSVSTTRRPDKDLLKNLGHDDELLAHGSNVLGALGDQRTGEGGAAQEVGPVDLVPRRRCSASSIAGNAWTPFSSTAACSARSSFSY